MNYIRFSSHRSRDRGLAYVANKQGFYSRERPSLYGIYAATDEEIKRIREFAPRVRFSKLRAPHDDLRKCWK